MTPTKARMLKGYKSSCFLEVQALGFKEGSEKTWAISYKVNMCFKEALMVVAPDHVLVEQPATQTGFLSS